jgi:hypothetical protein
MTYHTTLRYICGATMIISVAFTATVLAVVFANLSTAHASSRDLSALAASAHEQQTQSALLTTEIGTDSTTCLDYIGWKAGSGDDPSLVLEDPRGIANVRATVTAGSAEAAGGGDKNTPQVFFERISDNWMWGFMFMARSGEEWGSGETGIDNRALQFSYNKTTFDNPITITNLSGETPIINQSRLLNITPES